MLPDPKVKCPATAFARSCREIVAECDCPKFIPVKFRNPQTGEVVDKWGCADTFIVSVMIEAAQMSAQTGAAIESFRNEVVKGNEAAMAERRQALIDFARMGGPRLVALDTPN